jgi:putative FmdB family regulatory protein
VRLIIVGSILTGDVIMMEGAKDMPIYEYECENCGKFDKLQKFDDEILEVCPTCGGKAERIISKGVGVVLKGSGWYSRESKIKDQIRSLNRERQKDNQAIIDGDIGGYVKQSESTDKKISETIKSYSKSD